MKIPFPGTAVRGSKTGKPIMALLDLLGRRQTLRIIWELRSGSLKFRALQEAAQTSPGVLNTRLTELKAVGLVFVGKDGYCLTQSGKSLSVHVVALCGWADEWAGLQGGNEN